MTVYIIILHYGNIEDTRKCLRSITKLNTDSFRLKIILVCNSSTSGESLYAGHPRGVLRLIQNPKNLGFAAGVNVGVEEALKDKQTDYVLILNNDTILPPNLLQELLKNPADITAPVIKFKWNGKWTYDFGGKIDWNIGRTYHLESTNYPYSSSDPMLAGESRSFTSNSSRQARTIKSIDYVSGCCMLVKRGVFESIGLFDEKYFFYFEDADFCVRAKKAGFEITVNPNISIYHKLGGSVGRWTDKAIFYNLFGNFIFISKHLGWKIPIGYIYLLLLTGKIIIDRLMSFRVKRGISQLV